MIDDEQYLRIAVITGAHSLNGRLKIYVVSDNINRFKINNKVYLKEKQGYKEYTILEFIEKKNRICLLRLQGINDRTSSESYKGIEIFITRNEAEKNRNELKDDSYYFYDIIGCTVYLDGKKFSEVIDILEAGAGEILVLVDEKGKKYMVPFVESMVSIENISKKRIDIFPVEGLLDI